ncbi:hypothetical protein AF344_23630, partial [Salmonella enterica subsp. enterica serovar Typhimurium]
HKDAGESGRGLSVSVFASRQARRARQVKARERHWRVSAQIQLAEKFRFLAHSLTTFGRWGCGERWRLSHNGGQLIHRIRG